MKYEGNNSAIFGIFNIITSLIQWMIYFKKNMSQNKWCFKNFNVILITFCLCFDTIKGIKLFENEISGSL